MKQVGWPRVDTATVERLRIQRPLRAGALFSCNILLYLLLTVAGIEIQVWWFWFLALPVQALVLCGIFSVVHDCVHNSFVRSPLGNRICGTLLGALTATNFTFYKHFHLAHHANATLETDPEGKRTIRSVGDYLSCMFSVSFFVEMWRQTFAAINGSAPRYAKNPKYRKDVFVDGLVFVLWMSAVSAAVIYAPQQCTFGYVLPLMLYFPLMNITSLPEHFGTESAQSVLVNTRSTDSNKLFSMLYWYNNLHAEHHAYPTIPSYNLPQIRNIIGHLFKFRERSYCHFHITLIATLLREIKTRT